MLLILLLSIVMGCLSTDDINKEESPLISQGVNRATCNEIQCSVFILAGFEKASICCPLSKMAHCSCDAKLKAICKCE